MQNTIRVLVIFFLGTMILLNFSSVRLLSQALSFLKENTEQRAALVAKEVSGELAGKLGGNAPPKAENLLHFLMLNYSFDGIVIYNNAIQPEINLASQLPGDIQNFIQAPERSFSGHQNVRLNNYLIVPSSFLVKSTGEKKFLLLFFNEEKGNQIERSTKIISYSNFLLIGLTAFLALYFLESTLKPYRVLMQTARSAPSELSPPEGRNDAEFLIGTFKGVIAKLKEKEQELARLHQTEKARADNVQLLNQDLIRSVSNGLIIMDLSGKITIFNEAAQAILNVPRLTVLNESYRKIIPGISPGFKEDIDQCFEQKTSISRAEMEIQTREGLRYLGATIMPLKDREQRFAGVFCLFTDITEFKLLQQHMALKEKFAGLGEMSAGVAHEFRNSVATISGYLQLLENKIEPDQKGYIGSMQKELQELQSVVNDFLSFARPVKLEVTKVSLQGMLKEVVEEVKVSPAFSTITFSMTGEFPVIRADESMLRQVFLNLIRNAAESIDGSGRKGNVEAHGSVSGKFAVVEIRDNGIGIPPDNLPRIFTPFFSTKQKGVGLGLAIAQKLVLQHNGDTSVESSPEGSTFRVQLPIE
jgi:PAS domain S-box-containing protein